MAVNPRESIVERIERDDRTSTVVLSGDLDLSTISELKYALEQECSSSSTGLVVDIADVDFIDSSALHLFITLRHRLAARGGSLELVHVPEHLQRIFSITNLETLLLAGQPTNGKVLRPAT